MSISSTKGKMFAIIALSLTSVMCFGLAEVALRLLGYHGETYFQVDKTMLVDDPVLNWRHRPGSEFYFNDVTYRINELGFRDRVYSRGRNSEVFRILLASDSVGFGTNVNMEDSYPKILETRLNAAQKERRIEVLNFSMPGLSIRQKLHLIEQFSESYYPNMVVIDYVVNDIEFESRKAVGKESPESCAIELLRLPIPCKVKSSLKKSAFVFFISQSIENMLQRLNFEDRNHFYNQAVGDYYHRLYANPKKIKYLVDVFSRIEAYQRRSGIPVLMPIFPLIYDYDNYKWEDINETIIGLCRDHGIRYLSLLEEFRKFNYNEMRVQRGDFTHPSIRGNIVAAEAIAKLLHETELILATAPPSPAPSRRLSR